MELKLNRLGQLSSLRLLRPHKIQYTNNSCPAGHRSSFLIVSIDVMLIRIIWGTCFLYKIIDDFITLTLARLGTRRASPAAKRHYKTEINIEDSC